MCRCQSTDEPGYYFPIFLQYYSSWLSSSYLFIVEPLVICCCEYFLTDIDDGAFEDSFGHNQSFSMSDVLWACSSIFANW